MSEKNDHQQHSVNLEGKIGDNTDIVVMLNKYEDIICNMYLQFLKYKQGGIMKLTDYNIVIDELENLVEKVKSISNMILIETDEGLDIYGVLQDINDKLSSIMKQHGSPSIESILFICYGENYMKNVETLFETYFTQVLNKFIHPINYKIIPWSVIEDNKLKNRNKEKSSMLEDMYIAEISNTLDTHDLTKFTCDSLELKINGIK